MTGRLKNHFLLKKLASLKVAIVCLLLLFVLTFLGTYYQVDHGLYAAQQRFFTSYFLLLGGVVPFPGAKLVLWVFFFNLLAASLRYPWKWEKLGILMIHYGVLFLLVSAFLIHYFAQESVVVLEEGESTNVSEDYFFSELALMTVEKDPLTKSEIRKVRAFDETSISLDKTFSFPTDLGDLTVTPIYYYANSIPNNFKSEGVESASGVTTLSFLPPPAQREAITPGGLFEVNAPGWEISKKVLLWEGDESPFPIVLTDEVGKDQTYFLRLQRKRYLLPFEIELMKFVKKDHFGTDVAKSFESDVLIKFPHAETKDLVSRKTKIFMNNPLRTDGYTLFQASFSVDQSGYKRSIFATVENETYYVPYIASGIIGVGIIIHFLFMLGKRVRKNLKK